MSAALQAQGRLLVRERRHIGAKPVRDDRPTLKSHHLQGGFPCRKVHRT